MGASTPYISKTVKHNNITITIRRPILDDCEREKRAKLGRGCKYIMDIKTKIEKILSEILSDKHECKVTLRFEKKVES